MAWIKRALRTFDQRNESDRKLQAAKQQAEQKAREGDLKRAARSLTENIRIITGERVRVEWNRLARIEVQENPESIDFSAYIYGIVNLDRVDFGVNYIGGNDSWSELVVLQRDREGGLWTYQTVHTQAELGRVLQDLRTIRREGGGFLGVDGQPRWASAR